jgi:hypothetical protein
MFLFHCEVQNVANHVCDHPFLGRMNNAVCDTAVRRGNHPRTDRVLLFFEFDSKEFQTIANPGAFSPIPPVNTNLSSPPNKVANAPIYFLT